MGVEYKVRPRYYTGRCDKCRHMTVWHHSNGKVCKACLVKSKLKGIRIYDGYCERCRKYAQWEHAQGKYCKPCQSIIFAEQQAIRSKRHKDKVQKSYVPCGRCGEMTRPKTGPGPTRCDSCAVIVAREKHRIRNRRSRRSRENSYKPL